MKFREHNFFPLIFVTFRVFRESINESRKSFFSINFSISRTPKNRIRIICTHAHVDSPETQRGRIRIVWKIVYWKFNWRSTGRDVARIWWIHTWTKRRPHELPCWRMDVHLSDAHDWRRSARWRNSNSKFQFCFLCKAFWVCENHRRRLPHRERYRKLRRKPEKRESNKR